MMKQYLINECQMVFLVAAKKSFELTKGQLWSFLDFRFSRSPRGHRTCFHIIIGMISLRNFSGQFIAYILLILMVFECLAFGELGNFANLGNQVQNFND